ncbi:unnamed protein product [Cochlearia groenlandica]
MKRYLEEPTQEVASTSSPRPLEEGQAVVAKRTRCLAWYSFPLGFKEAKKNTTSSISHHSLKSVLKQGTSTTCLSIRNFLFSLGFPFSLLGCVKP